MSDGIANKTFPWGEEQKRVVKSHAPTNEERATTRQDEHVRYLRQVEAQCLRCHSCRCFHSSSRVGLVCYGELATYLLNGEYEDFERSVFGCHQCGMCLKRCPRQFNAKEFMAHARALMEFAGLDFAERLGVTWERGIDACGLDVNLQEVELEDGRRIPYDELLIATGSHTNHPPIPGLAKARNVYGFRNLSDAQQIHECVKEWKNIFVMGAGLVGMDVVAGLLVYGKKITLADMGPHMLPIQLDERSAGNYQRLFSQLGIEQFYKTGAKELMLDDAGFCTHVELSNGETIAVDAVINCAGVRPNVEFLSGTPLDLDRCGLAVDEFGRTNVQHVFGAGDVCGRSPIWPSAERQGMTAAYAMRTSVNWSRVFPTGSEEEPNEEGLLFYDCMIDAMVEQGLEPVLTVSHYEMPLALAMEHSGWHDRANIDKFVRCCQVLFDRHHDRVRRWILVNQINMVAHEGFNHLGVPTDETDDPLSARYQALHNEMLACARATGYAHEAYPELEIGVMLYADLAYPATAAPDDVMATYRRNQMELMPADVLVRGGYPSYALRFFEERGIAVVAEDEDLEVLAAHR